MNGQIEIRNEKKRKINERKETVKKIKNESDFVAEENYELQNKYQIHKNAHSLSMLCWNDINFCELKRNYKNSKGLRKCFKRQLKKPNIFGVGLMLCFMYKYIC